MNTKKIITIGATLFAISGAHAANFQLFFPAELNGAQILPPKFEYSLVDDSKLIIGDTLLDSKMLDFRITKSGSKEKLHFKWPAGLLSKGQIILKSSVGKAIWFEEINSENLKVRKAKAESSSKPQDSENEEQSAVFASYRNSIATYSSKEISDSISDEIKKTPFLKFCINRVDEETNANICSSEFFIKPTKNDSVGIEFRNLIQPAFVDINGKKVGDKGVIYLNDGSENVNFRAKMTNGSEFELTTKLNKVDFIDLIQDSNPEYVLISAKGRVPLNNNYKVRGQGVWQAKLLKQRPQLWLRGEGDIPLRQEFLIKDPIPTANDRPQITNTETILTLNPTKDWVLQPPPTAELKAGNEESAVVKKNDNTYTWQTLNLKSGQNRRLVEVKNNRGSFIAAQDIGKENPNTAKLQLAYGSDHKSINATAGFQWAIEDLLWLQQKWTQFHWYGEVSFDKTLAHDISTDFQSFTFLLKYSNNGNLSSQTQELTLGPLLKSTMNQGYNFTFIGLNLWTKFENSKWLKRTNTTSDLSINLLGPSSSKGIKISSGYEISPRINFSNSENKKYFVGLSYSKLNQQNTTNNSELKIFGSSEWSF